MNIIDNYNKLIYQIQHEHNYPLKHHDVQLMCVSKGRSVNDIKPLLAHNVKIFGENYLQEALNKWSILLPLYPQTELHMIGNLQSNKLKSIMQLFDCIHSVSKLRHLQLINQYMHQLQHKCKVSSFFLQVNLQNDQRQGWRISELPEAIKYAQQHQLTIRGLMCILPKNYHPEYYFAQMYHLNTILGYKELSMGMSSDYNIALRFGSSTIRIGSQIFYHAT